ncbi:MAG: hypothetical protein JO033_03370 [Acidobacteriaceae bacterium]|nr:hypothetical protein [Acidobacteriaceae bacterium]
MARPELKLKTFRVALVGGETLLGKELNELLESRETGVTVTTYAANAAGNFGEQEGEAVYVEPLGERAMREDQAILVAGSREGALKSYELVKEMGSQAILIDCTGHLHNQPGARLVAPIVEEADLHTGKLFVVAHPAAIALALVLGKLARYKRTRQVVANVFEPASERGKPGVSELHQQTTSLLSFKPLEKTIFDAQLSFNLLSRYGESAPSQLAQVEERIERNLSTLMTREAAQFPVPTIALRVIQAPVFHGYSISVWVEFEENVAAVALGEAIASAQVEVRGENDEAPDTVGVAGQSGLIAGDIRIDRNNARAAWLWIVGDNLRLTSDAALDVIRNFRKLSQ